MAACADIEFEIDEASKTDSNNSSHYIITHSENNQNNLPKKSFFRLDPNCGKRKALHCSFMKVLPSTKTSNLTITDKCSVPSTVNSTHQPFNKIYRYSHPWRVE